jgi:putative membrane protein
MKFFNINFVLSLFILATLTFTNTYALSKNTAEDGVILAYVVALDNHEIAVSSLVPQKPASADVKSYAKMLVDDHEANLKVADALSSSQNITLIDDKSIEKFKNKGAKDEAKLAAIDGKKFERAFLDAMIKGHKEAIEKLEMYVKKANNAQLKEFLQTTESAVKMHLIDAKKIRKAEKP